jgi:hypothetical protein
MLCPQVKRKITCTNTGAFKQTLIVYFIISIKKAACFTSCFIAFLVRLVGFEPTRVSPPPPQDGASAVPPQPHWGIAIKLNGAVERI